MVGRPLGSYLRTAFEEIAPAFPPKRTWAGSNELLNPAQQIASYLPAIARFHRGRIVALSARLSDRVATIDGNRGASNEIRSS
jgi:hypothetical protein